MIQINSHILAYTQKSVAYTEIKTFETKIQNLANIDTNYHSSGKGKVVVTANICLIYTSAGKVTFRIHVMVVLTGMTNYVMILETKG